MFAPILSIAIPTYNRSAFLNRCLESIVMQAIGLSTSIELIVSDNASTDDTSTVVEKYQKKFPVKYFVNTVNKGSDFNIATCFAKAQGKYVWIFGDDDFLLPGYLENILLLLRQDEYGAIFINALPYIKDFNEASHIGLPFDYKVYAEPLKFVSRVTYLVTFITSNIINKSALPPDIDYFEFLGTYLIQVNWTIKAIFSGKKNVSIETPLLACEQDNSGGYKYFKVFVENYNAIMSKLARKGIDKKFISITNNDFITRHLPSVLTNWLYSEENSYQKENVLAIVFSCYWQYPNFWRLLMPIFIKHRLSKRKK